MRRALSPSNKLNARGAAARERLNGCLPDAVVVSIEQRDGPVASAHQALRTEEVKRDLHRGPAGSRRSTQAQSSAVLSPETFARTFGCSAA